MPDKVTLPETIFLVSQSWLIMESFSYQLYLVLHFGASNLWIDTSALLNNYCLAYLNSLFRNFTSVSDLCFVANLSFGHSSRYIDNSKCFVISERFDTTSKFFFCSVICFDTYGSLIYLLNWSVCNVSRSARKAEDVLLVLLYPFSCISDF